MDLVSMLRTLRGEDPQRVDEKSDKRYPGGRGNYKTRKKTTSRKSRVPVYDTIKQALSKTSPGTIFSTDGSYRMYVTTAKGWGKSKQQRVSGKTAKGFTPGSATPKASWDSIKSHAARTKVKHGQGKAVKLTAKARREKKQKKEGK